MSATSATTTSDTAALPPAPLRRPAELPPDWSRIPLTVVMPTYNEAENLPLMAEALMGLDMPGLRLLVVDDNSPDGTGEVAERLAERYNTAGRTRVKVLHRTAKDGLGRAYAAGMDLAVNATPLGMSPGDPLPMDVARLEPRTVVGEVVMSTRITPLLAAARERGCPVQVGTDMLFEMIPAYLAFFGLPVADAQALRSVADLRD